MDDRFAINQVGDLTLAEDGSVFLDPRWQFTTTMVDEETIVSPPAHLGTGVVMGWSLQELHAIAHGVPCSCPVGQVLDQERG